tara:strand:- start:239 stop:613 length:375 start_codon:yes stop_codon:yes gene_type:complete
MIVLLFMTYLVACLSAGKGTWEHVKRVVEGQEWENVYLITNGFGKENFKCSKSVEFVLVDSNKFLPELIEEIRSKLNGKISDTEVALNFISGTGKEHMALMSAVLKLGFGIRLVALTKNGVKEV